MTGDIGQWNRDGTLSIIDRKKNLVKLSHGEYVALEKLESQYRTCMFISHICCHADPTRPHIVAIISPIHSELVTIAKLLEIDHLALSYQELCTEKSIVKYIRQQLSETAHKSKFKGAEILKYFVIVCEEWTTENFLTAAQKMKRKEILAFYSEEVAGMYGV